MAAEEKEEPVRKVKRSSKKSGKEKIQKGEQGESGHEKKAGAFDIWAAAKFEKMAPLAPVPLSTFNITTAAYPLPLYPFFSFPIPNLFAEGVFRGAAPRMPEGHSFH
ncbi:MAG: hypothetical protein GY950_31975 [bacterium]|nr:hypothetical protein [bacterium]